MRSMDGRTGAWMGGWIDGWMDRGWDGGKERQVV